jgi:type I site-specific restriction endonuclease
MTPEEKARQLIDRLLEQSGWQVQDFREMNISANITDPTNTLLRAWQTASASVIFGGARQ